MAQNNILLLRSKEKHAGGSETLRSRSRDATTGTANDDKSSAAEGTREASGSFLSAADVGPLSLPTFGVDDDLSRGGSRHHQRRRHRHQLKKSSSLTDFEHRIESVAIPRLDEITISKAYQAVGPPRSLSSYQLPLTSAGRQQQTTAGADWSSSSSSGSRPGRQAALLQQQQQQQVIHRHDEEEGQGPSRYSSRRSISNSFETVVGADRAASSGKDSLGTGTAI